MCVGMRMCGSFGAVGCFGMVFDLCACAVVACVDCFGDYFCFFWCGIVVLSVVYVYFLVFSDCCLIGVWICACLVLFCGFVFACLVLCGI